MNGNSDNRSSSAQELPLSESSAPNPIGTAAFGCFLVLFGTAVVYFARDIRGMSLGSHDPGPRAVPVATGILLILGGLVQFATAVIKEGLLQPRAGRTTPQELLQTAPKGTIAGPIVTILLLISYVIALNYLGFMVGTSLFLLLTLTWFGSRPWPTLVATVVIVLFVSLLFEKLFLVSLPSGTLF